MIANAIAIKRRGLNLLPARPLERLKDRSEEPTPKRELSSFFLIPL